MKTIFKQLDAVNWIGYIQIQNINVYACTGNLHKIMDIIKYKLNEFRLL